MPDFDIKITEACSGPLRADSIKILQLNLGYRCNMACKHCHIEAGPERNEIMSKDVIDSAIAIADENSIKLDLTGGAPELNPHFRYLVKKAKKSELQVTVRTNLTIFYEDPMQDLPEFYSEHEIDIVSSLPHYTEEAVNRVRGNDVFRKSIEALKRLNSLGYGKDSGKKRLHLVYNPIGAFLPASQKELEQQYRTELNSRYGIVFNDLYTFANMPIGRFRDYLNRSGNLDKYMSRLKDAFNPCNIDGLMCRHLISIGWDGTLYDCDFNQIAGLTVDINCPEHINNFDYAKLSERVIVTDEHCFACTAGQGST